MDDQRYKIVFGYTPKGRERSRKFGSLDEALRVAQRIFNITGIVVAIELAGRPRAASRRPPFIVEVR